MIIQDIISVILQEPNFTFVLQTDLTTSVLVPASCNGKARLLFISWSQSLTGPLSLDLVKNERLNVTSYFNALKFNVQYTVFFVTALYGLKYIQENKDTVLYNALIANPLTRPYLRHFLTKTNCMGWQFLKKKILILLI